MRILFLFPDLASDITNYTGIPSYGVALLSALLKDEGHDVQLYHLTTEPGREEFRSRLQDVAPDLVAFSTNSHYAHRLPTWTSWAAADTGVPVMVGGVHATLAPDAVLALPDVDFVCVGEGEGAVVDLCRALAAGEVPTDIPNIWRKEEDRIVRTPLRQLIDDLDDLPDPDFTLFDFHNLYPVRRGLFPYILSRGCIFRCTYCSVHALREMSPSGVRFWRFMSPRHAVEQLRRMMDRYYPETETVQFLDAILFRDRRWLKEFATLYKEHISLPFSCNLRADFVTEETAAILADMGCEIARFGVESGDEYMTTEILDRNLEVEDIRRAFELLGAVGIQRWSYNMVGLPRENLKMALKTIRLNAEIDPELALSFIFYPYPGTRLYDLCAEDGTLTDKEFDHYFMGVTTDNKEFPEGDVLFMHSFFRPLVKLYGWGRKLPGGGLSHWHDFLDAVLAGPLFPRTSLVRAHGRYRRVRHALGEFLVGRSTRLYRLLGGTDPT